MVQAFQSRDTNCLWKRLAVIGAHREILRCLTISTVVKFSIRRIVPHQYHLSSIRIIKRPFLTTEIVNPKTVSVLELYDFLFSKAAGFMTYVTS